MSKDAGCGALGATCLVVLVLAFGWDAFLAWLLTLVARGLGHPISFWLAFGIVVLVTALLGAAKGTSDAKHD